MRFLYSLLLYLATPLLLARLFWRGFAQREYWGRIGERFGFVPRSGHGVSVWVHAVSVGESVAALALVETLITAHPPRSVLVTTTTPTGSARVRAALGDRVLHTYTPYDLPDVVARFIARMRPRRVIVMETELWPNLFRALARERVPIIVANARLSPRSFARYLRIRRSMTRILADCRLIAAQSEPDAQRFMRLGADPKRVAVTGNLKFDQALPEAQLAAGAQWREAWGARRPVWVAASTHEGEEEIALRAHAQLLERMPQALLLLVPRHPQRFEAAARLCEKSRLTFARRSTVALPGALEGVQVLLGDSMGELASCFGASDVAFVAGSFVPVGGHNVLEPAAAGVPVLFGPHMFNFEQARSVLLDAGAARQLEDESQLAPEIAVLLGDPALRDTMGRAGRAVMAANRGALQRLLALLEKI
jgi:3-deoxy-D-manno-octulosonic-acid transferase